MQKKIYKFAKVFIIVAMLIWMAVTSFGSFYTVSNQIGRASCRERV